MVNNHNFLSQYNINVKKYAFQFIREYCFAAPCTIQDIILQNTVPVFTMHKATSCIINNEHNIKDIFCKKTAVCIYP